MFGVHAQVSFGLNNLEHFGIFWGIILRGSRAPEIEIWLCSSCIFMFFPILDPLKKSSKSNIFENPSKACPPGPRTFSIKPQKIRFFRLKTPGNFRDFLGDHFARLESSGDWNLTMFILDFHVFLHFWPPKIMKIQGFAKPFKTPSPGTMPRW